MNYRLHRHTINAVSHKKQGKNKFFIFSVLVGLATLTGCQSAVQDACLELPGVQLEVSAQIAAIAPYVSETKRRSLASVNKPPIAQPSAETRQEWMTWTEGLLKRSQWVRDGLETGSGKATRSALNSLNEATLTLVSVHGWLEMGKYRKAKAGLEQLSDQLRATEKFACIQAKAKPSKNDLN